MPRCRIVSMLSCVSASNGGPQQTERSQPNLCSASVAQFLQKNFISPALFLSFDPFLSSPVFLCCDQSISASVFDSCVRLLCEAYIMEFIATHQGRSAASSVERSSGLRIEIDSRTLRVTLTSVFSQNLIYKQ